MLPIGIGTAATIGGGDGNAAAGPHSTIAGGASNQARQAGGTIGGGASNVAAATYATVAGGFQNAAGSTEFISLLGDYATVSGGRNNLADGYAATVPGGEGNSARGDHALSCGYNAMALHDGAFVWNDGSTPATFSSTGQGQFLIRALGGVGINTNAPAVPLHVSGGTDAGPASGGFFQIGNTAGPNLAFDDNEIVARSNGGTSALFVQPDGGSVIVGGNSGGTVTFGIGTNSPGAFMLAVNGTAAKPGGGSWSTFSDARLKSDIADLSGALDDLLALRGVTFTYADREHFSYVPGKQIGFIAQEVETVFPQWISEDTDGYKTLTINGFEALTVEALREIRNDNDALRDENNALRARLSAIERALGLDAHSRSDALGDTR